MFNQEIRSTGTRKIQKEKYFSTQIFSGSKEVSSTRAAPQLSEAVQTAPLQAPRRCIADFAAADYAASYGAQRGTKAVLRRAVRAANCRMLRGEANRYNKSCTPACLCGRANILFIKVSFLPPFPHGSLGEDLSITYLNC